MALWSVRIPGPEVRDARRPPSDRDPRTAGKFREETFHAMPLSLSFTEICVMNVVSGSHRWFVLISGQLRRGFSESTSLGNAGSC